MVFEIVSLHFIYKYLYSTLPEPFGCENNPFIVYMQRKKWNFQLLLVLFFNRIVFYIFGFFFFGASMTKVSGQYNTLISNNMSGYS